MKIAILEDEADQAAAALSALDGDGRSCAVFASGDALVRELRRETFDLLVLDWNVPGVSGLDVALFAREHFGAALPILMLTARTASEDIVAALEGGADDFIVKPVDAAVLRARVGALLRRAYPAGAEQPQIAGYTFDATAHRVSWAGHAADLTDREFALALTLFRNLHRQLSRAYLLETVWGWSPDTQTRTLDAHVSRIRGKLGLTPENGFRLAPVYSYGYRLERLDAEGRATE